MIMLDNALSRRILELAVRGYTVRRIRMILTEEGYDLTDVTDVEIIDRIRADKERILALRVEADEDTRSALLYGLAQKLERVRRLAEAAERLEPRVHSDPKWAKEYRRYLEQIRAELEPLNIDVNVTGPWYELLKRLVDARDVDEGDLDPEEVDSG